MVRKAVADAVDETVGALNVVARAVVPSVSGPRSKFGIGRVHCKQDVGSPRGTGSADDLEAVRTLQALGLPSSFASPFNRRRNINQSQRSLVSGAVDLDIVPVVQQQHSPQHRPTGGAMVLISAYAVATQSHKGVRWIYKCMLVGRNFEVRQGIHRAVSSMTWRGEGEG